MLAMLTAAQLPLIYWGEAALTAGFLFNLTISSTLPKNITPFQILTNTKPDVSHLKVGIVADKPQTYNGFDLVFSLDYEILEKC